MNLISTDKTAAKNLGAVYRDGRTDFLVWAPNARTVELNLMGGRERLLPMERSALGYHHVSLDNTGPGTLYKYRLDGALDRPDPASRFQPQGVHGPSQVISSGFQWQDHHWFGLPLEDYIVYELHAGVFTAEGTFDAIIPRLNYLKELGVTAIEIMPVGQFPGERNWGYDGVYPFAVQNSYGGPEGLKRLVNACHLHGLAVSLDVVYNHLGPEGNYLRDFGPYFSDRYQNPWGSALNFDGPYSDEVRRFFIENALYLTEEFHIDAFRLDAVHTILDHSPMPFLEELGVEVHETANRLNRRIHLIAESADNNPRLTRSREVGGYGLDAQWNDDFHHSVRVIMTGSQDGYYQDYGRFSQLVEAVKEGFVYSGEYSSFRRRRHGRSSRHIPAERFVIFAQNHDQVGNRARGERLGEVVCFERLKLTAGIVLLSPFIPLLFMGEEYGETAPFLYFTSHSDPGLGEAVTRGRREEFAAFGWQGDIPDPQEETTFFSSKLNRELSQGGRHRILLNLYKTLIQLRKQSAALRRLSKKNLEVIGYEEERVLLIRRWHRLEEACMLFNFSDRRATVGFSLSEGNWVKCLDSAEERWQGNGSDIPEQLEAAGKLSLSLSTWSFAVFCRNAGGGRAS
ncbi:MAG: malto-oligosyltrehalose trehalohydrolase [Deltaproteobacteria bacterium]|nr:malto-oligosyltrehalose trehalohydrolase [Deltaproteobacteria bacterium]